MRRELHEEAGLETQALRYLYHYYPSPGGSDEQIALYIAEVDVTDLKPYHGVDGENEDIRVHRLKRTDVPVMQASGRINNAATLLSLMWLEKHLNQGHQGLLT